MKRDLYTEVSARIAAELEAGAAPWVKPWSATPRQPMRRTTHATIAPKAPAISFFCGRRRRPPAGVRRAFSRSNRRWIAANVSQRRARHEGVSSKSPCRADAGEDDKPRVRHDARIYGFQRCAMEPAGARIAIEAKAPRNQDARDAIADEFLKATGADIREGAGEAYYIPSRDFISMQAFAAFKGADQCSMRCIS
jgi:antirestriction protein ArdC